MHGLSLVAESGGYSLAGLCASHRGGFSCFGAQVLGAKASGVAAFGLRSCSSQALERRLNSCGCRGLVAPQRVGSSQTSDKPVSPALAGQFSTTEPPGKPYFFFMNVNIFYFTI